MNGDVAVDATWWDAWRDRADGPSSEVTGDGNGASSGHGDVGTRVSPCRKIVITEMMITPHSEISIYGEWFELYNGCDESIGLDGFRLLSGHGGSETHKIAASGAVLPGRGFLVLGASANKKENGGVGIHYEYSNIWLADTGDYLEIRDAEEKLVDRVAWDLSDPAWWKALTGNGTVQEAGAVSLDPRKLGATENDNPATWCNAGAMIPAPTVASDVPVFGTPGKVGPPCDQVESK